MSGIHDRETFDRMGNREKISENQAWLYISFFYENFWGGFFCKDKREGKKLFFSSLIK